MLRIDRAAWLVLAWVAGGCDVPNPRPGDMRTNPDADGLPANYVAPRPARTILNLKYGSLSSQLIDLYLPSAAVNPSGTRVPVLMWLHPGGWVAGARSPVPEMILREVSRGYAVAAVEYRLAAYDEATKLHTNIFPAAVYDVKTAIRWLKANAGKHRFRADRIIAVGASAGGHLAAFAGVSAGSYEPRGLPYALATVTSRVAGVVDMVGPTDLVSFVRINHPWAVGLPFVFLGYPDPAAPDLARLRAASVTTYLDRTDPPAYFAYGALDSLVVPASQGAPVAKAWANAKGDPNSVWYDLVERAGHNLDPSLVNMRALEKFLDNVVSGTLK